MPAARTRTDSTAEPAGSGRGARALVGLAVLVVALGCLIVGLSLQSAPWLGASLAASVLAALLVLIARRQAPTHTAPTHTARSDPSPPDGEPDESDVGSDADADADQVWVVDGRPLYHRRHCELIDDGPPGSDAQTAPAEPIPLDQADEDGFMQCSLCQPVRASAS